MRFLTILALLAGTAEATGLQVMTPNSLKGRFVNGEIPSHLGSHGHIDYGHSFVGKVYYPINNRNGCSPFVKSDFDTIGKDKNAVVLDHGGCSKVEKVKNSEMFGFLAAILIDDEAHDIYSLRASYGHNGEIQKIGYDLKIPYFKITGKAGESIIRQLQKSSKPVHIKFDMSLTHPDNRVEYELWYSSILDIRPDQIKEIGQFQKPFGMNTLFTPRILTYACELCPQEIKERDCISNGKYCPYAPRTHSTSEEEQDQPKYSNLELLMESLRERCIYESLIPKNEEKKTILLHNWYQYMILMAEEMTKGEMLSEDMSKEVMNVLDIDSDKIHECVQDSFDVNGDYQSENKYLKEDEKWKNIMGIHKHPAISINNQTYLGDFNGPDIGKAICASFYERPEICSEDNLVKSASDEQFKDIMDVGLGNDYDIGVLLIVGLFIVGINAGAIYIHKTHNKQRVQNDVRSEVNMAVAQYFALRGEEVKNDNLK